jgi:hypothetical protein
MGASYNLKRWLQTEGLLGRESGSLRLNFRDRDLLSRTASVHARSSRTFVMLPFLTLTFEISLYKGGVGGANHAADIERSRIIEYRIELPTSGIASLREAQPNEWHLTVAIPPEHSQLLRRFASIQDAVAVLECEESERLIEAGIRSTRLESANSQSKRVDHHNNTHMAR